MEGEIGGEFPDWEVLHGAADAPPLAKTAESFEVIGADSDSEGMIWSNYFSLDNQGRYVKTGVECDVSEEGSVESDNPSWIDPGLDDRHGGRHSLEFWSDSGSDRSEELKVRDVDAGAGLSAAELFKSRASSGEITGESKNLYEFDSGAGKYSDLDRKGELDFPEVMKIQMDIEETRTRGKDLGSTDLVAVDDINSGSGGDNRSSTVKENVSGEEDDDGKQAVEEEKKKVVWWKAPLEVLRFCAFRFSPVWSFSVAAAVMGFLILGRRLYKLKQKTQSLHLNITVDDDKKVLHFMNRVARLNEAFSVVRRVPMVRPPLPAAGAGITVNLWPATSMMR